MNFWNFWAFLKKSKIKVKFSKNLRENNSGIFPAFGEIYRHGKGNGTRLLSAETQCISCVVSCQITKYIAP